LNNKVKTSTNWKHSILIRIKSQLGTTQIEEHKERDKTPEVKKVDPTEDTQPKNEDKKKGWFWQKEDPPKKETAKKKKTEKEKDSLSSEGVQGGRVFHLNIDKAARPQEESKRVKQEELELLRTMGREFRDLIKLDEAGAEAKEERKQEMEKVKFARSYFKAVDQHRAETVSPVPKFRLEDETLEGTGLSVGDLNLVKRRSNFYQSNEGSNMRLSQFEPGKLNKCFTNVFENGAAENQERFRPPKKKLITLEQVLKKESPDLCEERLRREAEIEELKEARKNWVPPEESGEFTKGESQQAYKEDVKKRWQPVDGDKDQQVRSLETPGKVKISEVFKGDSTDSSDIKSNINAELKTIRDSRPTPVTKRWKHGNKDEKQVRSKSAHVLQRARLPDDSWVLEKSERGDEERRRAAMELEMVRRAREEFEQDNIYDFTAKRMDERRTEALLELEAIRNLRKNRPVDEDSDDRVDPRDLRKRELQALMEMRSAGNEFSVESTPKSSIMSSTPHQPVQRSKSDLQKSEKPKAKGKVSSGWAAKFQDKTKSEKTTVIKKVEVKAVKSDTTVEKSNSKLKSILKKDADASKKKEETAKSQQQAEDSSKKGGSTKQKVMKAMGSMTKKKSNTDEPKIDAKAADVKSSDKKVVKSTSGESKPMRPSSPVAKEVAEAIRSKSTELSETTRATTTKITKAISCASSETKAKVSKVFDKAPATTEAPQKPPPAQSGSNETETTGDSNTITKAFSSATKAISSAKLETKADIKAKVSKVFEKSAASPADAQQPQGITTESVSQAETSAVSKAFSSASKVINTASSETKADIMAKVSKVFEKPATESSQPAKPAEASNEAAESKPIYSKIFKKGEETKKEETKPKKEPVKSLDKLDSNKINFDDLQKFNIEKCNLKAGDSSVKILPSKVVNCTPRPFSRTGLEAPESGSRPSSVHLYECVDNNNTKKSVDNNMTATADEATVTENKFSSLFKPSSFNKKEDVKDASAEMKTSEAKPTDVASESKVDEPESRADKKIKKFLKSASFHKKEETEEKPVEPEAKKEPAPTNVSETTQTDTKTDKKIKKFLKASAGTKKEEVKEEKKAESKSSEEKATEKKSTGPLNMKQLTEILSGKAEPEAVVEKEPVKNVKLQTKTTKEKKEVEVTIEKKSTDKQAEEEDDKLKREGRLSVKFKELKDKTVTEVNKMTRGRSVQRGVPINREDGEGEEQKEERSRSESRSQKAGRMVKDFTSSILGKR